MGARRPCPDRSSAHLGVLRDPALFPSLGPQVYQPLELLLFVAALCTISDAFLPSLIAIPKVSKPRALAYLPCGAVWMHNQLPVRLVVPGSAVCLFIKCARLCACMDVCVCVCVCVCA